VEKFWTQTDVCLFVQSGQTILGMAIERKRFKILDFLFHQRIGAKEVMETIIQTFGDESVHLAVEQDCAHLFPALVDRGVPQNITNSVCLCVHLVFCDSNGSWNRMHFLCFQKGQSVLEMSIELKRVNVLEVLWKRRIGVNELLEMWINTFGDASLHVALENHCLSLFGSLVEVGVSPRVLDNICLSFVISYKIFVFV